MPSKLRNQLILLNVALTWLVGFAIAIVAYSHMSVNVRREAVARVQDAVRVGWRFLDDELQRLDPSAARLPFRVERYELTSREAEQLDELGILFATARREGVARSFVLVQQRPLVQPAGLCMVAVMPSKDGQGFVLAIRPLRGANEMPDLIRSLVFGSEGQEPGFATVTIFEGTERIATNVRTASGERAVGTHVSPQVANQVLRRGLSWSDRAFVVDRWVYSHYRPIIGPGGDVIGMLYAGLEEAPYVRRLYRSFSILILFIVGLAGAASLVGWILGRRLVSPLKSLTAAAETLARGSKKRIEVSSASPEEIRVLADAFNRMEDAVTQHAAALEASRGEAQKALDDYLEVLAFVAHELKSPFAGALTQLSFLESGYGGAVPEKMQRPLQVLRRYLERGNEMAVSFNHLSRAESRGFAPKAQVLHDFAAEVVKPAVDDFAEAAERKGMRITVKTEPVSIYADPALVRIALDNLISNAIKYGRENTEVRLTARRADASMRVDVWNAGVGIPTERYCDLFRKFSTLQDPQLRAQKGTGVGLYLVKRIVELHGGTVGVEGQYGQWVKFWFTLPLQTADAGGSGNE